MSTKVLKPGVYLGVCTALVLAPFGCQTGGARLPVKRDGLGATAGQVNAQRAYLPLRKIEPSPSKPQRPETLGPLSERAARQIPKARKLIDEQRYTEAAIELERALRYDPQHPVIHRTLAQLHWEAGNLERSKSHADRALKSNPDDAVSYYIRGRYLAMKGEHAAAILDLRTAMQCGDFMEQREIAALTHYQLAEALRADGYLGAAISEYEQHERMVAGLDRPFGHSELIRLATGEQSVIRKARADIYENLGRFAQAADALAPLAAARTEDIALGLRYARLLLSAGRPAEAIAAARAIPSDDDTVIELIYEIHSSRGRPERIVDELRSRIAARPSSEKAVLQLGTMYSRLGRAAEAQQEFECFLDRQPNSARARIALVKLLTDIGDWPNALRVCAVGIELDPDLTDLLSTQLIEAATALGTLPAFTKLDHDRADPTRAYLLGRVAAAVDRLDDAEEWLRVAYGHRPSFLPARVALARLLADRYRYDEAEEIAARLDEDAPVYVELELILGEICERREQFDDAERHFKAAMQHNRTDLRAMLALADLYRTSGQTLRGQRQLRTMLEVDPNHEMAREMLAYSYLREGKRDVAIEEFEKLRRRASDGKIKARCAALLEHVFKLEPDLEAFQGAMKASMKEHGEDPTTWLAIARSYDIIRQPAERADAFRSALNLEPSNEDATVGLVDALSRLLEFEKATRLFEKLVPKRPNRHTWRLSLRKSSLGLIDLYQIIQDFDAAIALLEEMDRGDDLEGLWRRRYRVAWIDTLRLAHRDKELTKRLETWLAEAEDKRFYRLFLADEHIRHERFDEATQLLRSVHDLSPDDRQSLASLVSVMAQSGETNRAEQLALDWLVQDPDNEGATSLLVSLLEQQERWDDAIELVRNRMIDAHDREGSQNQLIALLARAQRVGERMDLIELLIDQVETLFRTVEDFHAQRRVKRPEPQVMSTLPNQPYTTENLHRRFDELRYWLVTTLIQGKEYRAAEKQLNEWLEDARAPRKRFIYLRLLAGCLRAKGDENRAAEVYARALAMEPGDVGLNNDVAYGWIDQGRRLEDSEPMIRFAVSRDPRNSAYLDTYGWLLYKKGEFEEAMKWLLRAKGANPSDDPVIHDHLGDAAWRLTRKAEAIEHWEAVVKTAGKREENQVSADERRARDVAQRKIDAARAGATPEVAGLRVEEGKGGED